MLLVRFFLQMQERQLSKEVDGREDRNDTNETEYNMILELKKIFPWGK